MTIATISSKGWIVIPAALRKKYGLHPGDSVALVDYGNALMIVPAAMDPVRAARGLFKGDTSLVNALLEERAQEQSRER
ncbi:MAG TPA: AbrB/MazE/SpoVT family DNA-binding domain-containing protein [Chloroflexi bacterium]|jgi:AbrB family looped-hinge helix DNA binding protein|nr:AbrB/MazE/SpoVT family DNA-binding domain-containing protein [Caldilinea sp.]GIK72022.1 MAG: AbrB family transcriptional regulator [Chloroflexota bacterium]HHY54051.1 AbrB/MazE/SpoVT family DNA-binding domain-containing protein [Chloroflexota bacterium]